jgi:hypothetical protein
MGFGVSVKLAPGVRIRASTRGVRASVGPRAARVHVGSGRARVSSGVGPITVSSGGGSWRSASKTTRSASTADRGAGQRMTLAQLERQSRVAEREEQIAQVAALERQLTCLHYESFPAALRQVLDLPRPPTTSTLAALRRSMGRTAVAGISWFNRAERRAAKQTGVVAANDLARCRHLGALIQTQLDQVGLDEHFDALCRHDSDTVIEAVDAAFADNASESTCVDAGFDDIAGGVYVTCVVLFDAPDMVPEQRPDVTPGGKPTLRKRTKTDRNALYTLSLASTVLATAKEALAVAPAATEARILVVRREPGAATAADYLGVIYIGSFRREGLAHLDWTTIEPVEQLLTATGAQLQRKGSTREVVPLPAQDDEQLQSLLDDFSTSLRSGWPHEVERPGL